MKHLEKRILKCGCCSLLMALSALASGCSPKIAPTVVVAQHRRLDSIHVSTDRIYKEGRLIAVPSRPSPPARPSDPAVPSAGKNCPEGTLSSLVRVDTVEVTKVVERWHEREEENPVIKEVPVNVPYTPWYYRYPALAMYALLGAIVGLVIIKLTLKI